MIPAFELAPAERAEADRMLTELRAAGYTPADRIGMLATGVRIRHRGHQWIDALTDGSGHVVAVVERAAQPGFANFVSRDVELIAVWDRAPDVRMSRLSQHADRHVVAISEQWGRSGGEGRG
jgi:hypothetical protein